MLLQVFSLSHDCEVGDVVVQGVPVPVMYDQTRPDRAVCGNPYELRTKHPRVWLSNLNPCSWFFIAFPGSDRNVSDWLSFSGLSARLEFAVGGEVNSLGTPVPRFISKLYSCLFRAFIGAEYALPGCVGWGSVDVGFASCTTVGFPRSPARYGAKFGFPGSVLGDPETLVASNALQFHGDEGISCHANRSTGSGTTLIACNQLGRRCMAMELDPLYCDVIVKRWEEQSGEKAVLDDSQAVAEEAKVPE